MKYKHDYHKTSTVQSRINTYILPPAKSISIVESWGWNE